MRTVSWLAVLTVLGATAVVAQQSIPDLVSSWSGSNIKQFSGANDGYLINGATTGPGKIGKGFHFDGVDDYVWIPPDPRLNVSAQVSIALWMRGAPTNPLNDCCQGLVTTDFFGVSIASAPAGVVFYLHTTDGSWVHTSDTPGCSQCAGGFPFSSGEWHHIVGTYDGTQLQLYVDGVAAGDPVPHTGTILPMPKGGFLSIGSEDGRRTNDPNDRRYFSGDIDAVAIYGRALTAYEVQSLFLKG